MVSCKVLRVIKQLLATLVCSLVPTIPLPINPLPVLIQHRKGLESKI